jgi:hypothetical protein
MNPALFVLRHDALGQLVYVGDDGIAHTGVTPVRAFPLTAATDGIALLSATGKELQWIDSLDALPAALRALIVDELARREFMPVIQRIIRVSSFITPCTWQVATDRGATTLLLKSEDDIRRLKHPVPGALLISDSHGIHFLIRDRSQLDAQSQKILKRFL